MNASSWIVILVLIPSIIIVYYASTLFSHPTPSLPPVNTSPPKPLGIEIDSPKINKTTLSYANSTVEFVSAEEFPINVFSPEKMNVKLRTSEVPKGVWTEFIPKQLDTSSSGAAAKMILVGAVGLFGPTPLNTTMIIMAQASNGTIVKNSLLITQTQNITILGSPGPIEFTNVFDFNQNGTSFQYFGVVYDPGENSTDRSLSVSLSILGLMQDEKLVPLPSWLTLDIPEHSFVLDAKKPHYFIITGNTSLAPAGNYIIEVVETVGEQHFTQPLKISVLEPIRTRY